MNAGAFDELISLQSYTTTTDSNTGEKLQTWTTYGTAWAKVTEAPVGIEQVNGDKREHKQIVDFTVRYDAAIDVKHRVSWNDRYFNILNLQEQTRRMYLKIQTELSE
jgi:SPP1 family predicted phage head-tail adaptor